MVRSVAVCVMVLTMAAACAESEPLVTEAGEVARSDAALSSSMVLEAESFSLPVEDGKIYADSTASGGSALLIWSNGVATRSVTSFGRLTQLTVRARGEQCNGAPHLAVRLNGAQVMSVNVSSTQWTSYSVPLAAGVGTHLLELVYDNDYYDVCDRNLRVDSVTLTEETVSDNPALLEAEWMGVASGKGGSFGDSSASGGRVLGLWSNGSAWASHVTSGAGRVVVRARGDLCEGAPQMVLKVDGVERLNRTVTATAWTDYGVNVPLTDGSHRIEVFFTNDYGSTACDRNLILDKLSFAPAEYACNDAPPSYTISGRRIYLAPPPLGDDVNGDGSKTRPYFTLTRAASVAVPGDAIVMDGGTYKYGKSVFLTLNGTAAAPIVIMSEPGEKALIDGTGAQLSSHSALLTLRDSAYVIVDGLELANSSEAGLAITESHHITVQNSYIHHARYQAIRAGGTDLSFIGNELSHSVLSNKDAVLEPNGGGWAAGASTWRRADGSSSQRVSWINNYIHDHWGECLIGLFLDTGVIRGNRIHDCFSVSLYLDHARSMRIERNFIYTTTDLYNRNDGLLRAHGISLGAEYYSSVVLPPNDDILIANNLIVGTRNGLYFWSDSRNTTPDNTYRNMRVLHNVFTDMQREPVNLARVASTATLPSNCRFEGNVVVAAPGVSAVQIGNASAWTFANNDFPNGVPTLAQEPGTFAKDPMFASPTIASGPAGFRPKTGSPLIDAAALNASAPQDFWCAPRESRTNIGIAGP